jgi:hypothetical protein
VRSRFFIPGLAKVAKPGAPAPGFGLSGEFRCRYLKFSNTELTAVQKLTYPPSSEL